jgi:hypothetical protein
MVNLVTIKYQRAIPSVRQVLQTAREMVHFTFDVWTSRQNISYLGIHAHWVDQDWKQRTVLLGLPQLQNRHTGTQIAEEMKVAMKFFGVKGM